jgi:predicted N-formylglutamate amidohydrolase
MLPPMPLLTPTEPDALTIERPQGVSDFVFCCDHASRRIPEILGSLGLDEIELSSHIAWDIGAAGVARRLSALLDAALVLQNYSRLVIDCNRPLGAVSSIPVQSEYARIDMNAGLAPAAVADRVAEIFTPYHAGLAACLDERRDAGRRTLLVAVHSFTPVYLARPRPWKLGLMYRHERRLGVALLQALREDPELPVGDNEPYAISDATDYTLPTHGEARRLLHVGIEIRQDLIADESGQQTWAERLAQKLTQAARNIIDPPVDPPLE